MNNEEIKQLIKETALHNARTFMTQAFKLYELATNNPNHIHTDGTNVFESRANDVARDAEAQFKTASWS